MVKEDEQLVQSYQERGASLVEYALLISLIAVVAIAAVRLLGNTVSQQYSSVSSRLGG